jgi:protein-tyrosine-phosphatase
MKTISICFVCLGNICRSPTAEGVMRHQVDEAKLTERITVDSAGTGDWHIGAAPDERAQHAAAQRGYDLSGLRGRQIGVPDFERFDLLIAMDDANVAALHRICPSAQRDKIPLFRWRSGLRAGARSMRGRVPRTDRCAPSAAGALSGSRRHGPDGLPSAPFQCPIN